MWQMLGLVCMAALCGGYLYFMSRFTPAEGGGRSGFRRVGRDGGSASAIVASVRGLGSASSQPYPEFQTWLPVKHHSTAMVGVSDPHATVCAEFCWGS